LQEFAKLSPENTIYKQIGPVLVKQDILEAKTNVDTRLEFIKSEMFVFLKRMATILFDLLPQACVSRNKFRKHRKEKKRADRR